MKCILMLSAMLILAGGLTSCKDTGALCQNPPPRLSFQPVDSRGNDLITSANAGNVTVRYYRRGVLTSLPIQVSSPVITNYDIIAEARAGADTTRFLLLIEEKPTGTIQLLTYRDTSPCDGWMHASEVRFNGQIVPLNSTTYSYKLVSP